MKNLILLFLWACVPSLILAQVGINNDNSTPHPSSMLDVKSTSRGLLPPRMTQFELAQIVSPANGLVVYCTDCGTDGGGAFYGFQNGSWRILLTCQPPDSPIQGIHSATNDQIIWHWTSVPGVTGYRWGTGSSFPQALQVGNVTSFSENGLLCNTAYTRYVWAFTACGSSFPIVLNYSTTGTLPPSPASGIHTATSTGITWNWLPVPNAAGYRWNTVNDYNSAENLGNNTTKNESGLACNSPFTRFVWAYTVCGNSSPTVLTMSTTMNPTVSVSINASSNQVCQGTQVTFTAVPVNGGNTPGYQWIVNGNSISGASVSTYTYPPQQSDIVTCQLTSPVPCSPNNPALSNAITMQVNAAPASPLPAAPVSQMTQITWKWHPVASATGYKWNTSNNYTTAVEMGTDTVKNEPGLTCNTPFERYVWAYNLCGQFQAVTLTGNTLPCNTLGEPCPGMIYVNYGGHNYATVQIGTQCWMKENLNIGTRVNGIATQTNNAIIEKYCYNDSEDSCSVYGGLYQWQEAMQYATLPGSQGICPQGWHIPDDAEWTALSNFLGTPDSVGGKLKETGFTHWVSPNTAATNSSFFTALGGGYRRSDNGTYSSIRFGGHFYSSTDTSSTYVWKRYLGYNLGVIQRNANLKTNGFSIRCIKDVVVPERKNSELAK